MVKKSSKNSSYIYIILIVISLFVIFFVSKQYKYFSSYCYEPLQNFDVSFLNYRDFSTRLKTDEDTDDISGYKVNKFYRTNNFNELGVPYYTDKEIETDIKYFNNTSNVLYDFQKNNILDVTNKVIQ